MGQIWQDIEIIGIKKKKIVTALFDSGASFNYIRSENIYDNETPDDIGFHIYEGTKQSITADGRFVNVDWIKFKSLKINQLIINEPRFLIMKDLTWDAIIGTELMQECGIKLDLPRELILINDNK